jgi:hypothetical protein
MEHRRPRGLTLPTRRGKLQSNGKKSKLRACLELRATKRLSSIEIEMQATGVPLKWLHVLPLSPPARKQEQGEGAREYIGEEGESTAAEAASWGHDQGQPT